MEKNRQTDHAKTLQRSKNMKAVKSKKTDIENILARSLYSNSLSYRRNVKNIAGTPDFVLSKYRIAIFCDSEFWHGYEWEQKKEDIKSNKEFWYKKIERNIARDSEVNEALRNEGWMVLRFWGKEIKKNIEGCMAKIKQVIEDKQLIDKAKSTSLIEHLTGKKLKVTLYDPVPLQEKLAVVTHYLHNGKYNSELIREQANVYMQGLREALAGTGITETAEPMADYRKDGDLFNGFFDVPFLCDENHRFTFIDLFAGIGGFRMAMQSLGGKCVFSSEWDEQAQKTYFANYGEMPFGDITKEETKQYIPDNFDVLCAGFPCQAFSLAGKRGGFEDTRGTLFFDVAEIIRRKRPKAFFLENVKGLMSHDKGKTLEVILNTLREDLGYYVPDPEVVNARNFGVPQNRERIYIVGFRKDCCEEGFIYPEATDKTKTIADIKEENPVTARYYLSTQYLQTLRDHKERHASKGNGFGYEILNDDQVANAIVVGGMGRERNLLYDFRLTDYTPETKIKGEVNREGIRKMTPREWARLQGFPDDFKIIVADASAYKQFGNSVAVPAIRATAQEILNRIL